MADYSRIKDNIQSMINQNAPEEDIDAYLSEEGVTAGMLRSDPEEAGRAIQKAIQEGLPRDQIGLVFDQYNLDPSNAQGLDEAIKWRQEHGGYTGDVSVGSTTPASPVAAPHEDQGVLNAGVLGALDSAGLGFVDEFAAGVGAATNSAKQFFGAGTDEDFGEYYSRVRDENRAALGTAQNDHPVAFGTGSVVGGLAAPVFGGVGAGVRGAVQAGAVSGGIYGAGSADGDLLDRGAGALSGGLVGGAGAAGMAGVARLASPVVSDSVKRLLNAGVELTPGQILSQGGLVGRGLAKLETAGQYVPFVGKPIASAQENSRRSLTDAALSRTLRQDDLLANNLIPGSTIGVSPTRTLADRAMFRQGEDKMIDAWEAEMRIGRPEDRVNNAIKTSEAAYFNATPGSNREVLTERINKEVNAIADASPNGVLNPSNLTGNEALPLGLRNFAQDAETVFGSTPTTGSNYLDDLKGNALKYVTEKVLGNKWGGHLARTATGVGALATLGPKAIPLSVLGAGLYSNAGQRAFRNFANGGAEQIGQSLTAGAGVPANALINSYADEVPYVPNVGIKR